MIPALLLATLAPAHAASYEVDASHSHIGFAVVHMTISTVRGEFGTVSGKIDYDEKNVGATKVTATVGVSSVDTRDAKRDAHLQTADFFDAGTYPNMTFTSKAVKNASATGLDLVGDLTIRGVTKEVTFHLDPFSAEVKDPWGNTKRAAHATATINRQDFGVNFGAVLDNGGYVVANEVAIELDIEMKKI